MRRTGVVLLAAGSGVRFGRNKPKQLALLNKEPLFFSSLRVFLSLKTIAEIILVVPPAAIRRYQLLLHRHKIRGPITIVPGGAYRGESVKNGVNALSPRSTIILIHDSARPLVDKNIIRRVETAAKKNGVALAAWPLPDTLKLASDKNDVQKTIPRQNLWLAQTPQGFSRAAALRYLLRPSKSATDDVELAERHGARVKLVEGGPQNFKVTYPHDLRLSQVLKKI